MKIAQDITPVPLRKEMEDSYLSYAMSVIVGRALPDVRDGLKPVHRRVLYAMSELSNSWNKPYKKSARIVGDVIGKYHPHGESAIYDAIVRLAQKFSLRYPLIDGQGNFGSLDGDRAAAMRYTEVRMARIAHEIMSDLEKNTVDFAPNYDESESEPMLLPTRFPNLLVNGSDGIAVGMATRIPPHNLGEVIDASLALLDDPTLNSDALMEHVKGPDFPTAAIINGSRGIRDAYRSGQGRFHIRSRTHIEQLKSVDREAIVVDEIPYQTNKLELIKKIASLARNRILEGIADLRDESDKDGIRVVIEVRKGESAEILRNQLFAMTQLQQSYSISMVALIDGRPQLLNLVEILNAFIGHRREVITRRTLFELKKSRTRAHVLEGLAIALANLDPLIELVRAAPDAAAASQQLRARGWEPGFAASLVERSQNDQTPPATGAMRRGLYWLSAEQAQAILEMRLQRLTGLEREKIIEEYRQILENIEGLETILRDPERMKAVMREELEAVAAEFKDPRRTEIREDYENMTVEDLIEDEEVVITLSDTGYLKAQPISLYRSQKRGGRGRTAASLKEEDQVFALCTARRLDNVLFFTSKGRVFGQKAYQIPLASRTSRGRPIVNLLKLDEGERIATMLSGSSTKDQQGHFLFATARGHFKRTSIERFRNLNRAGLIAIRLRPDDKLVQVRTSLDDEGLVFLTTRQGRSALFQQRAARPLGRGASGVIGIRLKPDDRVCDLLLPGPDDEILTATERGFGKRTPVARYRLLRNRGGRGVLDIRTGERNGPVVGALCVREGQDLLLISKGGILVRTSIASVRRTGRNTGGVRLIRLGRDDRLARMAVIDPSEAEESEGREIEEGGPVEAATELQSGDFADEYPPQESEGGHSSGREEAED